VTAIGPVSISRACYAKQPSRLAWLAHHKGGSISFRRNSVIAVNNIFVFIIKSTPPSRHNKVSLKSNVHPSVQYVRLSVRPSTKSFIDFNDIWYVGRGRRLMHDGMQYNPIQGQGHEPLKVGNFGHFQRLSPPHL